MPEGLKLRRDSVEWRESDGELIAIDLRASEYISTNATGTRLWRALAEGTDREGLVRVLLDAYEVDEATAAADVDRYLATLRERGLLDG
ncbi:MAG TPA: PqqD family protein [Thermoleophilaceae bacterium]|nr:PqqD family protein [Thermoleophilaceae bacterium]